VFTRRVGKKALYDNVFANTAREHWFSVHTTRVHGPYGVSKMTPAMTLDILE